MLKWLGVIQIVALVVYFGIVNVIDARDVTDEASFLSSITYHITQATNEGKSKAVYYYICSKGWT